MGALSLSSKEELGNGQTFPGVCIPLPQHFFLHGDQVGRFPTLPCPGFHSTHPSSLLMLVMAKTSWRTLPMCHGCSPVEPVTSLKSNPSPFPWAIVSLLVLTPQTAQLLSKCGLGCTSWWVTASIYRGGFWPIPSILEPQFP